ncbi:hypothetical protein ABT337_12045 [Saccharopolyspora hirsuta]|uniref:Uncharacterized protein n=1 Tax=Saccharopolyspora hirsuta TaxID=1837 RepID=A0A5M7BRJ1_SACHI|nr:hypothetical protein [Saccharopolyspora hirsuta]KAA5832866.1 hypothetical protein F1721_18035 [Saccharopolyspora hirsuta]
MSTEAVPRTVRIAGVLTTLQAVAGLVFVVALLIRGTATLDGVGEFGPTQTYGEAGYFALLSAGVLAAGIGMLKGKHWARTPALLMQLMLLGTAWYAFGPSGQPVIGLVLAVPAIAVLWFMFNREGRRWSYYGNAAPDADRES